MVDGCLDPRGRCAANCCRATLRPGGRPCAGAGPASCCGDGGRRRLLTGGPARLGKAGAPSTGTEGFGERCTGTQKGERGGRTEGEGISCHLLNRLLRLVLASWSSPRTCTTRTAWLLDRAAAAGPAAGGQGRRDRRAADGLCSGRSGRHRCPGCSIREPNAAASRLCPPRPPRHAFLRVSRLTGGCWRVRRPDRRVANRVGQAGPGGKPLPWGKRNGLWTLDRRVSSGRRPARRRRSRSASPSRPPPGARRCSSSVR